MRIALHVDQLWFEAPGGIGTYIRELVPALQSEDPSLDLLPFRSRSSSRPAPVPWFGMMRGVVLPRTYRSLYPMWDLFGRPRLTFPVDIVHAPNPAAVPGVSGQRLVVTVHDLAFDRVPELFPRDWRLLYRMGLRAAAKRADAIIVPSRSTADDLLARTSVDPTRVHVTPLASSLVGVEDDPSASLERLGVAPPYVLSVGTIEPRKNLPHLVRAYRQVAPDVPHALVLAGPPGWHHEELEAEIARPGPGTIVRTGRVADADLDALYRGADAFAYLSFSEGFGLPVVEAMARGVPGVISNRSSLPEVAGGAAVLVDPDDVGAIAEALERLLTDAPFADELRRRGRERAATFSWAATARATLDVYRHVIGAS